MVLAASCGVATAGASSLSREGQGAGTVSDYANAPLSFVPNRGQNDSGLRYSAQGAGFGFGFGDGGVALSFPGSPPQDGGTALDAPELGEAGPGVLVGMAGARSIDLNLSFIGADPDASPSSQGRAPGRINYLLGDDPSRWQRNLPTFSQLSYESLWPRIDMRFRGRGGRLKYEFELAPGADPSQIALAYSGAHSLSIGPDGALLIETPRGTLRDAPPDSHQVIDGRRVPVESRYELRGEDEYGFELGAYDRTRPVLIDPGIDYATFLGGGGFEDAAGIAVDGGGSAYVVGRTGAPDFPTTGGAYDTAANGSDDVFVTKLAPDGGSLVYSTYIGGAGQDLGNAIALDDDGAAYVTGSTEAGFPTTPDALDGSFNGGSDAFVTKLAPDGASLAYSTFLGGPQFDRGYGIAVDGADSAYVTGAGAAGFPTTDDTATEFNTDVFVSKVAPEGDSFSYSTVMGSDNPEQGRAVAVDDAGSAYVTGYSETGNPAFGQYPTTGGAFDVEGSAGTRDAVVSKLTPNGGALSYSTFLGGTRGDMGAGIDVDDSGSAYVVGTTGGGNPTTAEEFPTTGGALDTTKGSASNDGFVTKVSPTGSSLVYSSLLGGDVNPGAGGAPDGASGVVVNDSGEAHVTGFTTTTDFPTTENAYQRTRSPLSSGDNDSFVSQFSRDGDRLVYSTYFPAGVGEVTEAAKGIDIDSAGDIYIAGADNGGMPTTPGAFDTSGSSDAFVAKLEAPRTLTVVRTEGSGSGTVTSEPEGIDCGTECEHDFDEGTEVTLTATPDPGSEFSHWVGACTDVNGDTCTLTMDSDRTERAVFDTAGPSADLSIAKTDSADPVAVGEEFDYTFTVDNQGPSGASDVVVTDLFPDEVELVESPPECELIESTFQCELGEIGNGGSHQVTVTVRATEAGTVSNTAEVFASSDDPNPTNNSDTETTMVTGGQGTLTVVRQGSGTGTVTSDPAGIDCGADCTGEYDVGTEVTLTATPDPGSEFSHWIGACTDVNGDTCTLTVDEDRTERAVFEPAGPSADLALTKTDSADPVGVGEEFDYTLTVDNLGPGGTDDVVVTDLIPSEVDVVEIPEECEFVESTLQCELGEMGNGGSRSLTLTVRATEAGEAANTAEVFHATADADSSNNSDTETTRIAEDSDRAVARWPLNRIDLDEAGRFTPDTSDNALDGREARATLVPGRFGDAFSLGGEGDGFHVPRDPVLEPQQGLSIVAWVRAAESPGAKRTIVSMGGRGSDCIEGPYSLDTGDNGGLELSLRLAGRFGGEFRVRTPAIVPERVWDGEWHPVTAVYRAPDYPNPTRGHFLAVWLDGVQVSADEFPETGGGISYSGIGEDAQLNAGRRPDEGCDADRSFVGALDEVRFYGEALDRREIRFLHDDAATAAPLLDDDTAPVSTGRPQVSGIPSPGRQLTCTEGQWTGNDTGDVTYTTVWDRAPRATRFEDDQAWAAIDGAEGAEYTVQDVDLGSRVRCRVTRTDDGGTADAFSRSLRVDGGVPVNLTPPRVIGNPVGIHVQECDEGEWRDAAPGDFSYQWLRDGQPAAGGGSTRRSYQLTRSRQPPSGTTTNPTGDGNHQISCRVTATNDVGPSVPATSPSVLAVDGAPFNTRRPLVAAPSLIGSPTIVGATASCSTGGWIDDYGQFGQEPYRYRYQWSRGEGDARAAISGATGRQYAVTVADLGRHLSCEVTNSNPAGESPPALSSNSWLVPLPGGIVDSEVFRLGGVNQADPTNLLAISNDYSRVVYALVEERLREGLRKVERDCEARGNVPAAPFVPGPDFERGRRIPNPFGRDRFIFVEIDPFTICRMVLRSPERVRVTPYGVRYLTGLCTPIPRLATASSPECRSLRIQVAPIDPRRPPSTDAELLERLAPVTPDRILWDLNGDGTTDASCPGSAPVLRTILEPGQWSPRAVIVDRDSAESGRFHFGETRFASAGATGSAKGRMRNGQVKVCATAFDPPPNPEQAPCVTAGEIGRVQIRGDLCPIDVREINSGDFANFDGDLRRALVAQSEERLKGEGVETSARRDRERGGPIWLDMEDPRPQAIFARAKIAQLIPGAGAVSAAYVNTAASLSAMRPGSLVPTPTQALTQKLGQIPSFNVPNGGFALNQIYVSRGDSMSINGMGLDPLGDSAALLVPSDVRGALSNVQSMTISARNAASFLGSKETGIPLAEAGNLKQELSDRAGAAGADLLRRTNLDQLAQRLQNEVGKLNLGPFKLRGTADVKLQDDGTATLTAEAVLPGLKLGPGGSTEARAGITLRGDLQGRVRLQGVRIKPPGIAYLGGVALKNLDLTYEDGIDIRGEILFPPPLSGASVAINRFKLGPQGQFQILDVDYKAGSGTGIKVGPGVFITKLGGSLNLLDDIVGGNTTLSVGPSPGGGCPTAGMNAGFSVHFAEQYFVDAKGTVQLACIDLADIKFHADQSGLVTLDGSVDKTLGPIFVKGNIGAAIRLPDWQATLNGSGGVRGIPLVGRVSAGFQLALSNIGLAGCGTIKVPVFPDLSGGAAVRFIDGRPPFTQAELLANLRFFVGCDLSEYRPVVQRSVARGAQAGSTSFTIPRGAGPSLLSLEGAGGAPRVRLRTPSGRLLDFSDATGEDGKTVAPGFGTVIEQEDRTVVLLGNTEPGTWTAEVAEGSTPIVRVQRADILPKPQVTGRVTGRGTRRVLRYRVKPIDGQSVRIVEVARSGRKVLRTVKRGGRGRIPFRVSEAQGRRRRILAEVVQDELPRDNLTVTRFRARSPRIGKPRRVRVLRRGRQGRRAVVVWRRARFARSYEVIVRTGTGRRFVVKPRRRSRRVVLRRIGKREGVVARVVAFSPGGRRGDYATGRLKGKVRVGSVRRVKAQRRDRSERRRRR